MEKLRNVAEKGPCLWRGAVGWVGVSWQGGKLSLTLMCSLEGVGLDRGS